MQPLTRPPGFLANLLTLNIARARWISQTNRALGHRTGLLFAYFLQSFANYGLATRLNAALSTAGSGHAESPALCFLLTGIPLIGATHRSRRAVSRLNDALLVRQRVAVPA